MVLVRKSGSGLKTQNSESHTDSFIAGDFILGVSRAGDCVPLGTVFLLNLATYSREDFGS